MKQNIIHVTGSSEFLSENNGVRRFMTVEPQGNRATRRAAQRATRGASKPVRKPGLVGANIPEFVIESATRLTDAERERALRPARDGFRALREGVATIDQWAYVCSAVEVALAIEAQGVIRGMQEHFKAAEHALNEVFKRVQDSTAGSEWGRRTTLYFDEITAIREGLHLHDEQLKVLPVRELHAARELAIRNVRNAGGQVLTPAAEPIPSPSQHPLL